MPDCLKKILLCIWFLGCFGPLAYSSEQTKLIDLSDSLTCRAFLSLPSERPPRALLLFLYGTGMFSVSGAGNPVGQQLREAESLAVLSFDKPGIETNGGRVGVRWEPFAQHKTQHLAECALSSILWALSKFEEQSLPPVILSTHSAGAETAISLVQLMHELHPRIEKQIQLIQFYGTPVQPWREMIAFQMANMESSEAAELGLALERADAKYFLDPRHGAIPWGYLSERLTATPFHQRLEQLLEHGAIAETSLSFYHGRSDTRCNYREVEHTVEQLSRVTDRVNLHLNEGDHSYDSAVVVLMSKEISRVLLKSSHRPAARAE